jgi:hypothetical protein
MKWTLKREAGETMAMGMLASGTQKAILLQPKAKTDADRISVIHLRHCTTETVAKETSIIVDAATKAGPMCELIDQVQQAAADAMGTISVRHPHTRAPTPRVCQPLVPWLAPSCEFAPGPWYQKRWRHSPSLTWRCTGRRRRGEHVKIQPACQGQADARGECRSQSCAVD